LEPHAVVAAIAERLIVGVAAAAERDGIASGEIKFVPLRIFEDDLS
jgi:hypothetical protein